MNVAIIPARGGSKRIPRKNLKNFCGKPMITYAIKAAKESGRFDRIVVSTDDSEIAEVAKQEGAEVPFLRSADLSCDHAGTLAVVNDGIRRLLSSGVGLGTIACIYPTVPLLDGVTLNRAFDTFLESPKSFLLAATAFDYPVQRGFRFSQEEGLQMLYPDEYETRSQDLPVIYHDAGQFYLASESTWLESERIYNANSRLFLMNKRQVCDIDTPEDWEWAEFLYRSWSRLRELDQLKS